jgi:uncharacterized membrane protein
MNKSTAGRSAAVGAIALALSQFACASPAYQVIAFGPGTPLAADHTSVVAGSVPAADGVTPKAAYRPYPHAWHKLHNDLPFASSALSVDRTGHEFAGWADDASGQPLPSTWTRQSARRTISLPYPSPYAVAEGVNSSGAVVGSTSTSAGGPSACFIALSAVATDLGTLGGDSCMAHGINEAGVIAGESNTAGGGSLHHAVLISHGVFQDLGRLPDGAYAAALAINDKGHAVIKADVDGGDWHVAYWNGSAMIDVGTPGLAESWAQAINNHDQIPILADNGHLYLYDGSTGTTTDLQPLIAGAADWNWGNKPPTGITDGGMIVGNGTYLGTPMSYAIVPVAAD